MREEDILKYLKQFLVIMIISFVGELLKIFLPLPVPASIYGMIILFILLETGLVKLGSVKGVGDFLIEIMPVMFIPAGVGLLESWGVLQPIIVRVISATLVTTITVMVASGLAAQTIIRKGGKKDE